VLCGKDPIFEKNYPYGEKGRLLTEAFRSRRGACVFFVVAKKYFFPINIFESALTFVRNAFDLSTVGLLNLF